MLWAFPYDCLSVWDASAPPHFVWLPLAYPSGPSLVTIFSWMESSLFVLQEHSTLPSIIAPSQASEFTSLAGNLQQYIHYKPIEMDSFIHHSAPGSCYHPWYVFVLKNTSEVFVVAAEKRRRRGNMIISFKYLENWR